MALKTFVKELLLGSESNKAYKPNPFYKKQRTNLKSIWDNKTYNDFGIERLLRLFLQLTAFIIPSSLIRQFSGTSNLLFRKLSVEAWGVLKIAFLIIVFKLDYTHNAIVLVISLVLSLDTLHFLISRIFLTDVFRQAISHKRSLIMTFLNYVEICLCFALIYAYRDHTAPAYIIVFVKDQHLTNLQAIYFSFVTSATIGYGDITPKDPLIMKVIISQILISLFLVVVIITNVTNKIEDDTFYNKKKKITSNSGEK
jgi:hypothetical protein